MVQSRNDSDVRMSPRPRDGDAGPAAGRDPGEIRQQIAGTRAEMRESNDAIEQELHPEHLHRAALSLLRGEATERVDRLIGEVTLRASRAGAMAAKVAQQVSREAMTRADAVRVRMTGDTPTATGRRTRQEVRTAGVRLRRWIREEPSRVAAVAAVVLAAVVIVGRLPRDARQARLRTLQRRAHR